MGMPFLGVCGRDSGREGDCVFEEGASVIGSGESDNTWASILGHDIVIIAFQVRAVLLMSFMLRIEE